MSHKLEVAATGENHDEPDLAKTVQATIRRNPKRL